MCKITIDELKRKHEFLYNRVGKELKQLLNHEGDKLTFLNEVESMLETMIQLSSETEVMDDYIWLATTIIKWQVELSSSFKDYRVIRVAPPSKNIKPRESEDAPLTENDLEEKQRKNAKLLGVHRVARLVRLGNQEEMDNDWHLSKIILASDILDGNPNFATQLSDQSYYRLENVWLHDIKEMRSYFIWEGRGGGFDPELKINDFYAVCEFLRTKLVDPYMKAPLDQFDKIKKYLEKHYLVDGKISQTQKLSNMLIREKAKRIMEKTGSIDCLVNWVNAEMYVKLFYNNIIHAVEDLDRDSIFKVLMAFQYSKELHDEYLIINCFEAAIAIYFLNLKIIDELWKEQNILKQPYRIKKPLPWPERFYIPKECADQFIVENESIVFKGQMSSKQMHLLRTLSEQKEFLCIKEKWLGIIEEIYFKTQKIQRETTF